MPKKKPRAHLRPVLTTEEMIEQQRSDLGAYVIYHYACLDPECDFRWQARYGLSQVPPPRTGANEGQRVLGCPLCEQTSAEVWAISGPIEEQEDVDRAAFGDGTPTVYLQRMTGEVIGQPTHQ